MALLTRGVKQPRHQAAMWFDGVNDYAATPYIPLNLQTLTICLRCWNAAYNAVSAYHGWNIIILKSSTHYGIVRLADHSLLYMLYTPGGHIYTTIEAADAPYKTWLTLALIFNQGTLTAYCNGKTTQNFLSGSLYNGGWGGFIGAYSGDTYKGYFNGIIDNVRFYNRALSVAECAAPPVPDASWIAWDPTNKRLVNKLGTYTPTTYGSPEQCLIHRRGAVIRTDANNQRYLVT